MLYYFRRQRHKERKCDRPDLAAFGINSSGNEFLATEAGHVVVMYCFLINNNQTVKLCVHHNQVNKTSVFERVEA